MCQPPARTRCQIPAESADADPGWHAFDPEAYFTHYYGDPHPDDEALTRLAADALRSAPPPGALLDILDVGTGPSLIPLLCALPRAARLTAWEFADPNVAWLRRELDGPALRPQWAHFWRIARAAHAAGTPDDPLPLLAARTRIVQGSAFDLPPRAWDAATMFFCAESITSRDDAFDAALAAFTRAVRHGGRVAAAFLVGSDGYDVAGRRFPAIRLGAAEIERRIRRHLATATCTPIGLAGTEIRSGYSGALFVSGITDDR